MNRRKVLARTLSGLVVIGAAFMLFVFGQSMRPTSKAVADLPHIDLSQLRPGEVRIVVEPTASVSEGFSGGIVFVRGEDNSVKAWRVLLHDGRVAMPDIHWWRPSHECKDFGIEKGVLTCKDSDTPAWWQAYWRWSFEGKALHGMVDDMEPEAGSMEGNFFIVGKRGK